MVHLHGRWDAAVSGTIRTPLDLELSAEVVCVTGTLLARTPLVTFRRGDPFTIALGGTRPGYYRYVRVTGPSGMIPLILDPPARRRVRPALDALGWPYELFWA